MQTTGRHLTHGMPSTSYVKPMAVQAVKLVTHVARPLFDITLSNIAVSLFRPLSPLSVTGRWDQPGNTQSQALWASSPAPRNMKDGALWASRPVTRQRPEGPVRERVCKHGPRTPPLWSVTVTRLPVHKLHRRHVHGNKIMVKFW